MVVEERPHETASRRSYRVVVRHVLDSRWLVLSPHSGDYFLTRNGDLAISTIREIHRVRLDKLTSVDPRSSSSVVRDQDLDHALLRASVGTTAENDKALEKLHFKLEKGAVRPSFTHASPPRPRKSQNDDDNKGGQLYSGDGSTRDLFSSFLLGSPMALETSISWPLDLFMTPAARTAYTDIHSFLFALRDVHLRISSCWASLSAAQRRRRKWTNTTEGGTAQEAQDRTRLARTAWGMVRIMLFFLDQVLSHFMTDIIEVQHQRLLDQLDGSDGTRPGAAALGSVRGSMRRPQSSRSLRREPGDTLHSSHSTQGAEASTVRSKMPPTPAAGPEYLDFLTLRWV